MASLKIIAASMLTLADREPGTIRRAALPRGLRLDLAKGAKSGRYALLMSRPDGKSPSDTEVAICHQAFFPGRQVERKDREQDGAVCLVTINESSEA